MLRSQNAKSGSDWTQNEFRAYNITVQLQDAATFFGVDPLPQPAVAQEVLTTLDADDMILDDNYKLLRYMDLAMNPVPTEESAVDDFAVHLLKLLGYLPRSRMAWTRADIPLWMCGELKTDVCIVESDDILLLIEENKRHKELKDPEPQLIAEAIAAWSGSHWAPISSKNLPKLLLSAITLRPPIVFAHLPTVARPARRWSEGVRAICQLAVRASELNGWQYFHLALIQRLDLPYPEPYSAPLLLPRIEGDG
ncbi:hypothetical protein F5051DRAFT_451463 [Lentinula edodes]|nr:hypothetical protein F5051DRAFT_451463 [Lentinula edodes]